MLRHRIMSALRHILSVLTIRHVRVHTLLLTATQLTIIHLIWLHLLSLLIIRRILVILTVLVVILTVVLPVSIGIRGLVVHFSENEKKNGKTLKNEKSWNWRLHNMELRSISGHFIRFRSSDHLNAFFSY